MESSEQNISQKVITAQAELQEQGFLPEALDQKAEAVNKNTQIVFDALKELAEQIKNYPDKDISEWLHDLFIPMKKGFYLDIEARPTPQDALEEAGVYIIDVLQYVLQQTFILPVYSPTKGLQKISQLRWQEIFGSIDFDKLKEKINAIIAQTSSDVDETLK